MVGLFFRPHMNTFCHDWLYKNMNRPLNSRYVCYFVAKRDIVDQFFVSSSCSTF
jgi:hypothetical protein